MAEEECSNETCNADDSMISHAGSSSIGDVVYQPPLMAPMTNDHDDNYLVNNMDAGHVGEIIVSPTSSSSPWQSSQTTAPYHGKSISLPNELWSKAFSYLDHQDLFMLGNVNRNFLSLSSDNSIWERLCHRRWMGKQNVARFEMKTCNNSATMQNCYDGRLPIARLQQFHDPTLIQPINIIGHFMYEATSWKEAFVIAEIDSRRVNMCIHEILRYKWQLIQHDGKASSDLRYFEKEDNINRICEYTKHDNNVRWGGSLQGQKISFPGVSLGVERNPYTWGWIITAQNQKGAYYSVEQEELFNYQL